MTSPGSHVPVMVATAAMLVARGGRAGTTGRARGPLAADRIQPDPGQHAVVVGGQRTPARTRPGPDPQPVPAADERAAVHPRPVPAARPGAGRRPARRPARPWHPARPPPRGRPPRPERPVAGGHRGWRPKHEPVSGRPGLGPLDGGVDQRRAGRGPGRLLARPVVAGHGLQRPALGPAAVTGGCIPAHPPVGSGRGIGSSRPRSWAASRGRPGWRASGGGPGGRGWAPSTARGRPGPTGPAGSWPRASRCWRPAPSGPPAGRCGRRHRPGPGPGTGCGPAGGGRSHRRRTSGSQPRHWTASARTRAEAVSGYSACSRATVPASRAGPGGAAGSPGPA